MYLTISYLSNASSELSHEEIENLMTDTKYFNDSNNISGILVYSDFTFFQVLEGESNMITTLFEKIKNDKRHYNVLKILEITSQNRRYYRYTTKFIVSYTNKALHELVKILENTDESIKDKNLHSLILYQSKILSSLV